MFPTNIVEPSTDRDIVGTGNASVIYFDLNDGRLGYTETSDAVQETQRN